jgi:hypothetical protein
MSADFRKTLLDAASAPYRSAGRFAWHFARGKLSRDPVFFGLLEHGVIPDADRLVDLGCGQGLLASWLRSARDLYERGVWPLGWPAPPKLGTIWGLELMAKDVDRARAALGNTAQFAVGDIRSADIGATEAVVILDVLHYIDYAAQDDVLRRVREALPAKGIFVTRIGDAAGGLPFRLSNWVDHAAAFFRGHRLAAFHCRPLRDWQATLENLGFAVETTPMCRGTPFDNVMLVARLN